jgi:hypothetical protein
MAPNTDLALKGSPSDEARASLRELVSFDGLRPPEKTLAVPRSQCGNNGVCQRLQWSAREATHRAQMYRKSPVFIGRRALQRKKWALSLYELIAGTHEIQADGSLSAVNQSSGERQALSVVRAIERKNVCHLRFRERAVEKIALDCVAVVRQQKSELIRRFHSFCHHLQF